MTCVVAIVEGHDLTIVIAVRTMRFPNVPIILVTFLYLYLDIITYSRREEVGNFP